VNVPGQRIRSINDRELNRDGQYVLYWMIACRRTRWNFALQRAVEMARELDRPLLILEPLACDYPHASDRLHTFILQGMAGNLRTLSGKALTYYPYVESASGKGKGLLAALSVQACLVITDDFPSLFFSRLTRSAGGHLPMRLEAVDGNGLLPMRVADRAFPTAYAFRRFLQKNLPQHLMEWPEDDPLEGLKDTSTLALPRAITERWPSAAPALQSAGEFRLDKLPVDHRVSPAQIRGGQDAARQRLTEFLDGKLDRYTEHRNHPDLDATSGLSPYLHFGHISSHEIFSAIVSREDWTPHDLSMRTDGKRSGWWRMSADAEAFLDQLVTWRELGFNMCCFEPDHYRDYGSLPDWARKPLDDHRHDSRLYCYTLQQFADSQTHDPLWNAAQNQLRREGIMHNYLRMLWGKKIIEWSATPKQALEIMIELNDRYALDGRDPNSYSGIFWCLGRYDRAWGPEREIFGKVRYMSSDNTRRKVKLTRYLERYK